MSEPVRVFVSHHHSPEEDAFTARLVADLEAAGADVWVDTTGIMSGPFVQKINEGLDGRQWLVMVMTPASLASQWVRLEVDTAIAEYRAGRMLGVIPFIMLSCKDTDIPYLWRTFQRYDATKGYEAARDGLLRALGISMSAAKSTPQAQGGEIIWGGIDPAIAASLRALKYPPVEKSRPETLDDLLMLSGEAFEGVVAWMLIALGYHNVKRLPLGHPFDLSCTAPDDRSVYVCWKVYRSGRPMGVNILHELVGSLADRDAFDVAMIVCTPGFTSAARVEAAGNNGRIKLIDGHQLITGIQHGQPR